MSLTSKRTLCALAGLLISAYPLHAAVTMDEYGWTIVTPSVDSRVLYVSSSEGNDANDGLSPDRPKKTIESANAQVRNGYPDHILLKRGDTFEVTNGTLGRWKNGRSADEPLLLSYYGDSGDRPIVEVEGSLVHHAARVRSFQTFIGLDIYKPTSDPASDKFANVESGSGLAMVGGGQSMHVEDCRFRFVSLTIQSFGEDADGAPQEYSDFKFRRNIVTDTWKHKSISEGKHIDGMYVSGVDGYILEENYFDHCGWNEVIPDTGANMYAHSVYVQYSNKAGGIYRGNISTRPAAHGAQLRSGGIAERNLFAASAIGANFGGVAPPTDPDVMTFDNVFRENVIIDGRRMDPDTSAWPRTSAVWGFKVAYVGEVDVIDNIVANRRDEGNTDAYGTVEEPSSLVMVDNISYKWDTNDDGPVDPSWPHPDHGLGDYFASIGGENDPIAYYEYLRNRPIRTMPWEMTAYAAINYIRAGFNKEPVEGYYLYDDAAGGGDSEEDDGIWVDWAMDEEGYVNAEGWLGWIYVDGEWVYSYKTDGWMYLPEPAVTPGGAWGYIVR